MAEREKVLDYIENLDKKIKPIMTVERTTNSKYLFLLLVRALKRKLRRDVSFITYTKNEAPMVKAALEEHSIFTDHKLIYVLEGFPQRFVDTLSLPDGTYLLAEVDGGFLQAENYHYGLRRDILKVLSILLGTQNLSLRDLLKCDWSGFNCYEDYEVFLRRAKLLDWNEERIAKELESTTAGSVLISLKKGNFKALQEVIRRYSYQGFYTILIKSLTDLIHYKALLGMGFDALKCEKELELGYRRGKEMEEAAQMFTTTDLALLAQRVVDLDGLVQKNKEVGLDLLMFNSNIGVKTWQ